MCIPLAMNMWYIRDVTAYRLGTTDPLHVSFSSGVDDTFGEDVGMRSCVFGLVIRSDRYRFCCLHAVSTY
jgi:hypothetical protein